MQSPSFVVNFYGMRGTEMQIVGSIEVPTEDQAIQAAKVGSLGRAGAVALRIDETSAVSVLRTFGAVPRVRTPLAA